MSTAAELLADAMQLLAEHRELAGAGELLARYEQLVADTTTLPSVCRWWRNKLK